LWPVLLILLGIDLVLGRRAGMLSAAITAVVLIGVVAVAIGLTVRAPSAAGAPALQSSDVRVPLDRATSGEITMEVPIGTLDVGALPAKGDALLEARTSMPAAMRLVRQSKVREGVAQVLLSATGDESLGEAFPLSWPFNSPDRRGGIVWNVLLSPTTPLTLRADVGVGQSDLDLTNLLVQQLTLNHGAGETTIHFPSNAGQTIADVQSGAGQLTLIVPPDVGAYIHTPKGGVVNVQVPPDRFQAVGDGYETANYANAANRVDVTLHLGVGSVDVRSGAAHT
ncbi:MAG: hypothetical protein ACRDIY_14185, partial [Chloroflexota bacterium]